jgi:hypothetical protein
MEKELNLEEIKPSDITPAPAPEESKLSKILSLFQQNPELINKTLDSILLVRQSQDSEEGVPVSISPINN